MELTGAALLAQVLGASGIRHVSGIPGHTVFPFVNEITPASGLEPLLVRHEALSAFAADAYFRVSGDLMAVFAHSLPGVANMAAGIGNAYADSSAMLVIVGETATEASGRGAYQELARSADGDVPQFVSHITKRSWQVRTVGQLVEHTVRAIKTAKLGRPGPVAVHVAQEVWDQKITLDGPLDLDGYFPTNAFRPDQASTDRAASLIREAKRPLILAGNGVNLSGARGQLRRLAEQLGAPVATSVSGKGAFPEDHPLSVGVIGWVGTSCANKAGREADLVLTVGARLSESTTSSWQAGASLDFRTSKLIQCEVEPAEVSNVFPADVALIGDAARTLSDLAAAVEHCAPDPDWLAGIWADKATWRETVHELSHGGADPRPVGPVVAALRRGLAGTPATIVCDIGKHAKWIAQQFETSASDIVISSMGAGTMGIGPCGAIGAALAGGGRKTIAWTGDGGMSMSSYALPTAAEYQIPVLFVVIDDQSFGEIVNLQQQRFGRTVFAEFNGNGRNPGYALDLAAVAIAAGVPARRVEAGDDLDAAFEWGLAQSGPALIDVMVDRRSRVPLAGGFKLTDIWNHPIQPWVKTTPAQVVEASR